MSPSLYRLLLILLGGGFAVVFTVLCVPPLLENPDLLGAAMAGFVNPFSSGYALDTIMSWCVLTVWVVYEAKVKGIRHGWIAPVLGLAPGVATGFAFYLLLRLKQEVAANHSLEGRQP